MRFNVESAKAVTLAYAVGSDLDHIASRYNVQRLVIDPGDPNALPQPRLLLQHVAHLLLDAPVIGLRLLPDDRIHRIRHLANGHDLHDASRYRLQ